MTAAYELLDAGDGRRLERFGDVVVDRPAADAVEAPLDPSAWDAADLRYERYHGWSATAGDVPASWEIADGDLRLELRPTPTGQVGLFPEQALNRAWVRDVVASRGEAVSVLNLFAYTGAMTLSAAAGGRAGDARRRGASGDRLGPAQRRAVRAWRTGRSAGSSTTARRSSPREGRRERRYDGVVLDPPSYGHGAGGRSMEARRPAAGPARGVRDAHRTAAGVRAPDRAHARASGPAGSRTSSRTRSGDLSRTSTRASWSCEPGAGRTCGSGAYARIIGR